VDTAEPKHPGAGRLGKSAIMEFVVRQMRAGARAQEPCVAALRPGQRRIEHRAVAVDQCGVLKAYKLTRSRKVESVPFHRIHGEEQLWLPKIGWRDRKIRVLQRLEPLDASQNPERPVAVGESTFAWQVGLRSDRQPVGVIREIGIVGNLWQVDVTR